MGIDHLLFVRALNLIVSGASEIFYRIQLVQELQATPDLQAIWDPSLNRDEDRVAVFGLRGRAEW